MSEKIRVLIRIDKFEIVFEANNFSPCPGLYWNHTIRLLCLGYGKRKYQPEHSINRNS